MADAEPSTLVRDLEARLRASEERCRKLEQAARETERLAELGALTGGLAHEIKNPLSTVQLNLQLLGEDFDSAAANYPRLASRLSTVRRETDRLREILDDFLRFAGKLEVERVPLELYALLEKLADFFTPQAELHKIRLRPPPLVPGRPPITVLADPRLIKQLVLNLMLNATQAMPRGGELILAARAEPRFGVVDVIDTGTGISPDVIARIFDAYYSTKRGGTGLGLAMARRIAWEHGGELTVTSVPGQGSDFTLKLPLAE